MKCDTETETKLNDSGGRHIVSCANEAKVDGKCYICTIERLEAELESHRWIPVEERLREELEVCEECGNTTKIEGGNYLIWCKTCWEKVVAENKRLLEENKALNDLLESRCVPAGTPPIVCLCGSTRFMDAFFQAGWKFTLEGQIVLSIGFCKHAEHHGGEAMGQEVADKLDELHFRKIDLADTVFVLNVGGYIGSSTRKEIDYAESLKKPINYLEPEAERTADA